MRCKPQADGTFGDAGRLRPGAGLQRVYNFRRATVSEFLDSVAAGGGLYAARVDVVVRGAQNLARLLTGSPIA